MINQVKLVTVINYLLVIKLGVDVGAHFLPVEISPTPIAEREGKFPFSGSTKLCFLPRSVIAAIITPLGILNVHSLSNKQ